MVITLPLTPKTKLAAGIHKKPQTVYAWFNESRIPSPALCRLIAAYLHIPEAAVLAEAGHIVATNTEDSLEEEPSWVALLPMLTKEDAELVGRLVEQLVQRPPSGPGEGAQEEPQ